LNVVAKSLGIAFRDGCSATGFACRVAWPMQSVSVAATDFFKFDILNQLHRSADADALIVNIKAADICKATAKVVEQINV